MPITWGSAHPEEDSGQSLRDDFSPMKGTDMLSHLVKFQVKFDELRDRHERGATAVEYGLMVALIAAAIVITVGALGTQLNTLFTDIKGKLVAP